MAAVAWSRRGARSNGTENAVRSKDSISGKRSSRVDDPKPSFPVWFRFPQTALISCRCPTDGACCNLGAGNPSFGDLPDDSGGTYTCRSHPRSPPEPNRGLFFAPRARGCFHRRPARGGLGRRLQRAGTGNRGLSPESVRSRFCASFARIGLTGVKPAANDRQAWRTSIRARRRSDIRCGRPLISVARSKRECVLARLGSRTNPDWPRQTDGSAQDGGTF